jgi:hypothetical protein
MCLANAIGAGHWPVGLSIVMARTTAITMDRGKDRGNGKAKEIGKGKGTGIGSGFGRTFDGTS